MNKFEKLIDLIIENSETNELDFNEWTLYIYMNKDYIKYLENDNNIHNKFNNTNIDITTCGCGKKKLIYGSVIYNNKTNKFISIGSSCIKKIFNQINITNDKYDNNSMIINKWLYKMKILDKSISFENKIKNNIQFVINYNNKYYKTKYNNVYKISIKNFNKLNDLAELSGYNIYSIQNLKHNYIYIYSEYDIDEYLEAYDNTLFLKAYINKKINIRFILEQPRNMN